MNYPPLPYDVRPPADYVLQTQRNYLNGKAPGKGEEFYEFMLDQLDWISANYGVPPDAPHHPGMKRRVLKNEWSVIYEVTPTEVVIAAVLWPGQNVTETED